MRPRRMLLTLALPIGLLTAGHGLVWAAGEQPQPSTKAADKDVKSIGVGAENPDADNTARNVRDRDEAAKTPETQSENATDRNITIAIRRAITSDDSLSTNAHNVKIVTQDQVVTLRGPVDSEAEKSKIAAYAHKAEGVKRVDNQLEINKQ